jgi:predicted ATPase/DNA-binding CsgD family transcriptional regulator
LPFPHASATPLHGRTAELEASVQRLTAEGMRLLTLTGPAGVGKTRLALAAGERLVPAFPDGVVFVDLTVVREPSLVLGAVATQLGLVDRGIGSLPDRLQEYLRDRALLLILDNFEHVLTAASALPPLLAAAPHTRILVTSRIPLRLRWEQTIRLFPLSVPEPDHALGIDALVQVPSVALLVERVQAQRADFTPTAQQAPSLIALTRQLDGLPLALELAAAQAQTLPLAVIARRLERHVQSLRWDAADLPERHHSLEAALGWSYQLLTGAEQRLFRHLGVFVGRVSPDAVAAVLGETDDDAVLDRLTVLAEQSLVVPAGTDADAEPSFGMLETVRQYAHEQLEAGGELHAAKRAHADYFTALAEHAEPALRGPGQRSWRHRLEAEHDNLRAALRWLLDVRGHEQALQLAGALGHFWWLRGSLTEGGQWLEEALATASDAAPPIRLRALLETGLMLAAREDIIRLRALLEAGLMLAAREELAAAIAASRDALTLAQAHADPHALAQVLTTLGVVSSATGDLTAGERNFRDALARWEELGDTYYAARTLGALAGLAFLRGDWREAEQLWVSALARFQGIGELVEAVYYRFAIAITRMQAGDRSAAVAPIRDGLGESRAFQERWLVAAGAEATLLLVGEDADLEGRARLLGTADALAKATGFKTGFLSAATGLSLTPVREQIEREGMQQAYREGRALGIDDTAALALELLEGCALRLAGGVTAAREPGRASPLSPREQEVLRLVAKGLTSKQIGQQLFLSPRTIDHHLTSIFNKLGVETRAQAVAVATRDGLV